MKVLVTYGFHKEEKEICEEVCSEYMRRYSPPQDLLRVMPIKNSANRWNERQEERASNERSMLIIENRPAVLIDIHHSVGFSPSIRKEWEDRFLPKKVRFEDKILPLMIMYANASVNKPLHKYVVLRQRDLGITGTVRALEHETATLYGIAHIALELVLFGDGRRIHRDARYHQALENSVEFIHRIQEFEAARMA